MYAVSGYKAEDFEETEETPEHRTFMDGLWAHLDAEAAKFGGRLRWMGEYPGLKECREFGFWCKEDPVTKRYHRCEANEEGATEDITRLFFGGAEWNREKQCWERRNPERYW